MLAWEIAKQWQAANCMTPFEELLGAYLSSGLLHSTPEVFLLAREVTWDPSTKQIIPSSRSRLLSPGNAWFVELAASNHHSNPIREFLRVVTHPLPYVLWCRQSVNRQHDIHAYRWSHLARRVNLSSPPLCDCRPGRCFASVTAAPLRENL